MNAKILDKSSRPYVVGIDPGFTGALTVLDIKTKKIVTIKDTPLLDHPSRAGKKVIDQIGLAMWVGMYSPDIRAAIIEDVHAMPEQGVSSTFRFGQGYGIITGILSAFLLPIHTVSPATWKLSVGLSSNKKESLTLANEIFPEHTHLFTRVKDNGRAESALIALYGLATFLS